MDVRIVQTPDGGEIDITDGRVALDGGLSTAVYLALFGGNQADDGREGNRAQWWGNLDVPSAERYRSRLAHYLDKLAAVPANLRRLEDAARQDLASLIDSGVLSDANPVIELTGVNRIRVTVTIEGDETLTFAANWKAEL